VSLLPRLGDKHSSTEQSTAPPLPCPSTHIPPAPSTSASRPSLPTHQCEFCCCALRRPWLTPHSIRQLSIPQYDGYSNSESESCLQTPTDEMEMDLDMDHAAASHDQQKPTDASLQPYIANEALSNSYGHWICGSTLSFLRYPDPQLQPTPAPTEVLDRETRKPSLAQTERQESGIPPPLPYSTAFRPASPNRRSRYPSSCRIRIDPVSPCSTTPKPKTYKIVPARSLSPSLPRKRPGALYSKARAACGIGSSITWTVTLLTQLERVALQYNRGCTHPYTRACLLQACRPLHRDFARRTAATNFVFEIDGD
jgi:hypothetical protein